MSEPDIILEYRQMCQLEEERDGDKAGGDRTHFQDDGYSQELESLGITQEMLDQMRGK